ncbi:MAG: NAD(P)H-dependent oxidoreductase [Bacteroidota bacterium]|nr:NAD(P)H-dependent oxidoreductase [Bacteroidota bacterium]
MKYTIISGSNRKDSASEKVAVVYQKVLEEKGIPAEVLTMVDLEVWHRSESFLQVEKSLLIPTTHFIFIIPEYNGTFPGVLKAMIDNTDISKVWYHKKALLTGVSSGRAGNLRGIDHLAASLNYLKVHVHYNKLPISQIEKVMDSDGQLNSETLKVIEEQIEEFIHF